jgi:hypothetical protein
MTSIDIRTKILEAKSMNSCASRTTRLQKVPTKNGTYPKSDFPETLMNLLIAGNDTLPNGTKNQWNKQKSLKLLQEYGQDCSDFAGDSEQSERECRVKVAQMIGIGYAQLSLSILSL